MPDECPYCGSTETEYLGFEDSGGTYADSIAETCRCLDCGAAFPIAEFRMTGVWITTEQGHTGHALVDPDVSPETLEAMGALIDAAHRAIEDGTLKRDEEDQ